MAAVAPKIQAQDWGAVARILDEATQKRNQAAADRKAGKLTEAEWMKRLEQINAETEAAMQQAQSPSVTEAQLRRAEELYEKEFVLRAQQYEGRITTDEFEKQNAPVQQELWQMITNAGMEGGKTIGAVRDRLKKERWPTDPGMINEEVMARTLHFIFRQPTETRASHWYNDTEGESSLFYTITLTGAPQVIRQTYNEWKRRIETSYGSMESYEYAGGETHTDYYSIAVPSSKTVSGWPAGLTICLRKEGGLIFEFFYLKKDP